MSVAALFGRASAENGTCVGVDFPCAVPDVQVVEDVWLVQELQRREVAGALQVCWIARDNLRLVELKYLPAKHTEGERDNQLNSAKLS